DPETRVMLTAGPHDPADCWSTPCTPDFNENLSVNVSSATPLRSDTTDSAADTSSKSPSQLRTWSTTWDPEAPSHPPPRVGSNHQPGVGAAGLASSGVNDA